MLVSMDSTMEAIASMCAGKVDGPFAVVDHKLIGGLENAWPSFWTLMSVLCNVSTSWSHLERVRDYPTHPFGQQWSFMEMATASAFRWAICKLHRLKPMFSWSSARKTRFDGSISFGLETRGTWKRYPKCAAGPSWATWMCHHLVVGDFLSKCPRSADSIFMIFFLC